MAAPGIVRTLPYIVGLPERSFRLAPLRLDGDSLRGGMQTGAWNVGPDDRGSAGSLGVLIDDVLGYLPAVHRPEGRWAVSTQTHVDFAGPVPADGSEITATSEMVSLDGSVALVRGELVDSSGRPVAVATQRMRFVSRTPPADLIEGTAGPLPGSAPPADHQLLELLGGELWLHEGGARLRIPLGPAVSNPLDMMHGGITLCAMQLVGNHAVQHEDRPLTTTSLTVSYLLPGPVTGQAVFEATTLHRSRSVGLVDVVLRDAAGRVCSHATVMSQAL